MEGLRDGKIDIETETGIGLNLLADGTDVGELFLSFVPSFDFWTNATT